MNDASSAGSGSVSGSSYQPQLDGLRALAVLAVLCDHYALLPEHIFPFGIVGVRAFFVLSGYFITRTLLKSFAQAETLGQSRMPAVGRYLVARGARIVPAYLFAITVAFALNLPDVRDSILWHAAFLTNFYALWLGYFPETMSHFWSLAVQEQFYLIWPLALMVVPRRWLIPFFVGTSLGAVAFRAGCIAAGVPDIVRWMIPLSSMDAFAWGALAAVLHRDGLAAQWLARPNVVRWMACATMAAAGAAYVLRGAPVTPVTAWTEWLEGFILAWVVLLLFRGVRGPVGAALAWGPLTYVGRVSYGVYLYHVFVRILLEPALMEYELVAWRGGVLIAATIAAAALSYHALEQPLLRLLRNGGGRPPSAPTLETKAA